MALVWLLVIGYLGYNFWQKSLSAPKAQRQEALQRVVDYAMTAAVLWTAFRSGSIWMALVLFSILVFTRGANAYKKAQRAHQAPEEQPRPGSPKMSKERALAILGLPASASQEQIKTRYKELMRKMHPDHGGSEALAAELNEAKRVLLG